MVRMGNTGQTSSWVWFINCGCGLYNHHVLHILSQVLKTGWMNRRVASTSMNRESSRSHAVFTLVLESKKRVRREGGREGKRREKERDDFTIFLQESLGSEAKIKTSLLNLVDLAGSERQRDMRSAGVRLKASGDGVDVGICTV